MWRKTVEIIRKWPGEKLLGPYRFLPLFFVNGMILEYVMIHWRPNDINFYDTFKKRKSYELAKKKYNLIKEIEKL